MHASFNIFLRLEASNSIALNFSAQPRAARSSSTNMSLCESKSFPSPPIVNALHASASSRLWDRVISKSVNRDVSLSAS
ncbi:hypothetical protein FRC02_007095 [Tulasnella sp. 418]|nr:hypothetical protein FRC02_007095 [Tulasnella sp. 418]